MIQSTTLLAGLQNTWSQFWEARQERERTTLQLAALFLVLTLIYLIGIEPALTGRETVRKSLPVLHQQAAQMQQMAQELASLPSPENRREVTRELVETALAANGLKAQTLSVSNGIVRAQLANATMSGLQAWLLQLQTSAGLFVDEIKITGIEAGQVSVTLALRQSLAGTSS